MIEDLGSSGDDISLAAELAVIGAGPAGIVVALEAARHGVSVLLLESGDRGFDPAVQDLSEAAEWDRHRHAPLSLAVRRQVGGTSVIWGGRCVPFDPVDFAPRSYLDLPAWPIGYALSRRARAESGQHGRPVRGAGPAGTAEARHRPAVLLR